LFRRQAALVGLCIVAGVMTLVFAQHGFPRGAPDLDEAAYRAQASALSHGHVTLPSNYSPSFRPFLSGFHDGRIVFKYQPAWPALLAVSERLLGSTLPLRTGLAVLGVVGVFGLALDLLRDRRVALVAAGFFAISPLLWVQAATVLGYQLTVVVGALAAWAYVRWTRSHSRAAALSAGALTGVAVIHRPFDALIMLAAVVLWTLWTAWHHRLLVPFLRDVALGGLPFAAVLLAYNTAVTGSPFRFAFGLSGPLDSFGFGWRASFVVPNVGHNGQIHFTPARAFSTFQSVSAVMPRFVGAAPVVLVAAPLVCIFRRRTWQARLLLAMLASIVAGYFFWWGTANAIHFGLQVSLGPFYHYAVLVPLAILAGWGVVTWARTPARIAGVVVVALVWAVPAGWMSFTRARHEGVIQAHRVARLDAPGARLVIESPTFTGNPYLDVANDADLRADRVVALDVPGERLHVFDRFAGRPVYLERAYRELNDLLGPIKTDRVLVHAVRAPAVRAQLHVSGHQEIYTRIGSNTRGFPPSTTSVEIGARDLPGDGSTVTVAFGVFTDAAHRSWIECTTEAHRTPTGVEILTPCDGWHHYAFPDGRTATSREDVSPSLGVVLSAA
jgi:hypothetical protein